MKLQKITSVAKKVGIKASDLTLYGNYMAKVEPQKPANGHKAKYILVTAITPTKAGEGKTTTSIALADGLTLLGKKAVVALREPSLGPVFGMKGGATGGGKVTVEPSENINLHFTGDLHALTSAIDLIAAIIDNHIFQGNELHIDPNRIVYKRAMDMNDRALREITVAESDSVNKKGEPVNGVKRQDSFVITVAHEMMAIMCLAEDEDDFKERLGRMIVAYNTSNQPVTVKDLKVVNAVMKLMKDALKPNLVQTSGHAPAFIHGGPFANIAHGCNSIIATKTALAVGDYVVTEAGFGSDLGAEKFLDIKCQVAGIQPDLIVIVATVRALKLHGGVNFNDLGQENVAAMMLGTENLKRHVENMKKFGVPVMVNINKFYADTANEVKALEDWLKSQGYSYALNDGYEKGGRGAVEAAQMALDIMSKQVSHYHPLVVSSMTIEEKISTICREIYGAKGVEYSSEAQKKLTDYKAMGCDSYYVCMAKTPMSFTDDPAVLNAPNDFVIHVRSIDMAAGSRFIIPITGTILTMPGLPKVPAAVLMEDEKND